MVYILLWTFKAIFFLVYGYDTNLTDTLKILREAFYDLNKNKEYVLNSFLIKLLEIKVTAQITWIMRSHGKEQNQKF